MAAEPHNNHIIERLGRSLRRRRWGWLAATLGLMAMVWSSAAKVFEDTTHHTWADWATIGLGAYALLAVIFLVPRFVAPRLREKAPGDRLALVRWSIALAPFLVGIAGLAAGAHGWSAGLATATGAVSLAYTAATIHRSLPGREIRA